MPSSTLTQTIAAPPTRIAELVRTCLAQSGWRIELINEDLCELTANLNRSERIKGVNWNYEYRCIATWEPLDDGVSVAIEIREERNQWTQENCKAQATEIMRGLNDRSTRLARVEQSKPQPSRYGSARWGTHDDIVKAGYWCEVDDHRRLIVSPGFDDNFVTVSAEDTAKHTIVCGPTGSGKTTAVFIPNLIQRLQSSAIVTEATAGNEPPDLYSKTAAYRKIVGQQEIYYFNPDDLQSDRINPIDSVTSYAKAQQLAQLIVENTTSKNNYGDDVWPKSEANLLTILVAHAAAEKKHLGFIRALLREGPDGLRPIMAASKVEQVRDEYRGFHINSREGFRYGVFAGLIQRLSLWVNPRIVALTETTDFDLEQLRHQLFTFYLATPAQKTHLKPLAALVFNFILEQALELDFDHPLYLSLDEFTNFGMIPGIADKLSIIRHKSIGVMLGFQDFSQLTKVYGKEDSQQLFSQPATQFFFRPRTLELAERISKKAGMTTILERKMTSSGQIQERESGRSLIDPGEVLALDPQDMIVFTDKCPPLKLPRFTWQDFEDSAVLPPLPKPLIEVDERLVKDCEESKHPQDWQSAGEAARKKEMGEPGAPAPAEKPKTTKSSKGEPKQDRNRFRPRKGKPKESREKDEARTPKPQPKPVEPEWDKDTSFE